MWPFSQSQTERSLSSLNDAYDFIVVGGGNAGCVLARRLSDHGAYSVLLIEKGDAGDSWLHRTPLFSLHHLSDGKHSTVFPSTHDEQLDRPVTLITGRGLGGSTRINGGQYICGVPGEYNAWAQAGNIAWSYEELKVFFKRSKKWLGTVSREFHGTEGPLQVRSFLGYAYRSSERMYQAAKTLGFLPIEDGHSPLEPSFGCNKMQFTVGADGTRQSSFRAYLPPDLIQERSSRLHVCTRVVGARLLFSSVSGGVMRADAIVVRSLDGKASRTISAKREIVLACGTLASPQLLLLSGIGPAAHLEEVGVPTIIDLPGVGEHLDHLWLPTTYNCPLYDSLWAAIIRPHILIREVYRYLRHGAGWLLGTMVESEVFGISSLIAEDGTPLPHTKDREDPSNPENLPDFAVLSTGLGDPRGPGADRSKGFYGLNCALLKPKSLGRVSLRSADPLDPPKVETRYLSHPDDYHVLRAALRVSLALTHTMRDAGYYLKGVHVPDASSDAALDAFIRDWADTMMHYTSTCRMAPRVDAKGRLGVVNASLHVYGVQNVRVADASVIPVAPASHPQAAVYAIAEKCADMMLRDAV